VRSELDKRAMAALSSGHCAVDFAGGALPALLPFVVDRFDLSYTLAAAVMLASTASSSFVQPLFGHWSDRRGGVWLLPAGVAIAAVGIGLASASPSYPLVLLFVVLSGIGVAAYHPEASKAAAFASGRRRASGMSLFSIGGNVGFALGPVVATPLVLALGLTGGLLLAVPGLAVALVLSALVPFIRGFVPEERERLSGETGEDQPAALALLLGVISFRSIAWYGLITFVPLWELHLGHSKGEANRMLALMLIAGGLGTIVAGPVADRLGRRPVLLASLAATPPLILVFVLVGGAPGAIALAFVGVCVIGTFGVTMVMSQEYMPRNLGMASGLAIGLSIAPGGVLAVALGALADSVDLRTALLVIAGVPTLAVLLGLLLPSAGRRPFAPEPVAP
jgi:FSR family fosmidomycin resistance protein-like MFS transporter